MKKHLLISVASAALIGASTLAFAQAPGGQSQGGASSAQQSAPAGGASQNEPAARGGEGMSGGKMAPHEGRGEQRAQEQPGGMKSKAVESDVKGGKAVQEKSASENGMKGNRNAAESKDLDSKAPNAKSASETKSDSKAGTTTGQAGAGAKQLTSEQRSTVRTSISRQGIKPVTNVNFSISVGTRVPRGVGFHPLPVEIVNIYPDYRGYEFILVGDQIVVVNPRTLEIVAGLEA